MPSASSLFSAVLYFRKFSSGELLGIGPNLRRIFICQDEDVVRRAPPGAIQGPGAGYSRGQGRPVGPPRPCSLWGPSAPSDAYRILLTLKTSGRPLFSTKSFRSRRHLETQFGVILKLILAPCRRGDRSRRALHRHAFHRDDV